MQLAILLVLILIAVILAPWLLGVAAMLAAAYWLWLVAAAVLALVFGLVVLAILALRSSFFPSREISSKTENLIAEANRQHREKEAAQRAQSAETESLPKEEVERVKKPRTVACKSCSALIEKYSLYCPVCGKSPK